VIKWGLKKKSLFCYSSISFFLLVNQGVNNDKRYFYQDPFLSFKKTI